MTISVLIVDDSPTCRALIRKSLNKNPELYVMGTASSPEEARDLILREEPDVISLDVEMPGMNGLQFLEKIMRRRPIPVVMTSSLTSKGADVAVAALQMGAFDCFFKHETPAGQDPFEGLDQLLIAASKQDLKKKQAADKTQAGDTSNNVWKGRGHLIAVGASTGGVDALETLLSQLPKDAPPIVICQHMPPMFIKSLAVRLNKSVALDVATAKDSETLKEGQVRIAMSDKAHLRVQKVGGHYVTSYVSGEMVSDHRPSIDVLFASVARAAGADSIGIILTGMGRDGAEGLLEMYQAGALTITQDRESSAVYGMPRAAKQAGAVTKELPLNRIAPFISQNKS